MSEGIQRGGGGDPQQGAPPANPFSPPPGRLRAINPENGFFGVAPGTSMKTNPNAMHTVQRNTLFTNVGETSEGGVYWEGIDQLLPPGTSITNWLGRPWAPGRAMAASPSSPTSSSPQRPLTSLSVPGAKEPCAHPNSRFCAPARQCPIMDPAWESPEGVPIDAIIFGGRRPQGNPHHPFPPPPGLLGPSAGSRCSPPLPRGATGLRSLQLAAWRLCGQRHEVRVHRGCRTQR